LNQKKLAPPTGKVKGLIPTENRVIVEQLPAEEQIGGIVIPESAKEKPKVGQIVALGPDCKQVKLNDWVSFEAYAGTELNIFGRTAMVMPEDQILVVIDIEEPKKGGKK